MIESRPRYLLAASADIGEAAIRARLHKLLEQVPDEDISVVEGNKSLLKVVREAAPSAKLAESARSRVNVKNLLSDADRLILFWDGVDLTTLLFEARLASLPTRLISVAVTRVVNKKLTDKFDVYIGRGSPWGNPFAISHGDGPDRAEVISQYRDYFYEKIQNEPKFKKGVLGLRGLRLACFCKPEACHGDVIAEYLNNDNEPEGS